MNNITIGQYVPGDSWIYKMDPRLKIILTIFFVVLIFFIPNVYGMLVALGIYFLLFLTTRIPVLKMIKGLKPVLMLLIFTFVLQIVYTKDAEAAPVYIFNFQFTMWHLFIIIGLLLAYFLLKKWMPFKIIFLLLIILGCFACQWQLNFDSFVWGNYSLEVYEAGIIKGSYIFVRIVLMIGITSLLTFSTMSTDINNGLAAVMSPLKVLHVPVGVISMTLSLTLRFIPTLLEETKKILNAQASRGVDFNEGTLKEKVNQIISLLIPMFVVSFKRAEDLANAMEARGYIIDGKRTKLDLLKFHVIDYVALFVSAIMLGVVIWANFGFVGIL